MKHSKSPRQTQDEPQTPTPESRYHVAHYGKSRNFAAYDRKTLIAVTLYRKGAEAITARLEDQDRRIAALESQLTAVPQTPVSPALPSAEPVKAQAWTPPRQLALIAAEDMAAYRTTSQRRRRPAHAMRRP